MIGPRMATMLAFLVTDAQVAPADLQAILSEAVESTFNCISVEGTPAPTTPSSSSPTGAAGANCSRAQPWPSSPPRCKPPARRSPG